MPSTRSRTEVTSQLLEKTGYEKRQTSMIKSHLLAYSITNLIASNLHKNSKVCKVITRTRYFIVDFFDQRASHLRPIPIYVASTIIERKQRKNYLEYILIVIIRKFLFFGSSKEKVKNIGVLLAHLSGLRLYGCTVRVVLCNKEMRSTTRSKVCF